MASITETHSATQAVAVTPSGADVPCSPCRAVLIGGAGNLEVVMSGGGAHTFAVQAGIYAISVKQVNDAGTTATGVFALY